MNDRLAWLDMFRGFAAIVVMAFHLSGDLGLPQIDFGVLAVDLFFVLSGIVLGRRYAEAIRSGMPASDFAWHRMRRLYPMVLIAAALCAAILLFGLPQRHYAVMTPGTLVSLLLVTPYPGSQAHDLAFPADPVMWSLCAEFLSNAIWFVTLRIGRRATQVTFAIAATCLAALAIKHGGLDLGAGANWVSHVQAIAKALTWFGVGTLISVHSPKPLAPVSVLLAFLVGACAASRAQLLPTLAGHLLIMVPGIALLIGLMQSNQPGPRIARLCAAMGMLSYPLYLIHLPASLVATRVSTATGGGVFAYLLVVFALAAAAARLNEWITRRLPTSLRTTSVIAQPAPSQ